MLTLITLFQTISPDNKTSNNNSNSSALYLAGNFDRSTTFSSPTVNKHWFFVCSYRFLRFAPREKTAKRPWSTGATRQRTCCWTAARRSCGRSTDCWLGKSRRPATRWTSRQSRTSADSILVKFWIEQTERCFSTVKQWVNLCFFKKKLLLMRWFELITVK